MAITLYNTLTQQKESFIPLTEGKVGIYVCGITTYDYCHLGHARSAIVFDSIVRYLTYRGYDVTYVKNFTDVDDKIIERAHREGVTITDVAERFIAAHDEDMAYLGVLTPTVTPRATEHIPDMIALIATLIAHGIAYATPQGDVYFAVEKLPTYGKLSHRELGDLLAGARIEVSEQKRNPLDFALWKAAKEGEPRWESPWGPGRPGWHTECVVMSRRYLGETFDIHGGGEDLIFPHHENEIAQAEGATGTSLARYWLHNGFIRVSGEKMSKSLGNVTTIRELQKRWPGEVIRLFVLQSHYRSPIDISDDSLTESCRALRRAYLTMSALSSRLGSGEAKGQLGEGGEKLLASITDLRERFITAMDDDFNTARALGCLFETVRKANTYLQQGGGKSPVASHLQHALSEMGMALGLLQDDPIRYLEQDRILAAERYGVDLDEIARWVEERIVARAAKDWSRADEIRKQLVAMNVALKDTPQGTEWYLD